MLTEPHVCGLTLSAALLELKLTEVTNLTVSNTPRFVLSLNFQLILFHL